MTGSLALSCEYILESLQDITDARIQEMLEALWEERKRRVKEKLGDKNDS